MKTHDGRVLSRQRPTVGPNKKQGCVLLTALPRTRNDNIGRENISQAQQTGTQSTTSDTERTDTARNTAVAISTEHTEQRKRLRTLGNAIKYASSNHAVLLDRAIGLAERISIAIGTKVQRSSHWSYWTEFMRLVDQDIHTFGTQQGTRHASTYLRQQTELLTLNRFFSHVVFKPHRRRKSHNTAAYARKVINSVREEYIKHYNRTIGPPGPDLNRELLQLEKGLKKVAPSTEKPHLSVLQYHMRAVRKTLDMNNKKLDRALWALWCTQFQGVLRAGDLIRPTMEKSREWEPDLDTHRGRYTFSRVRGETHAEGRIRMKLQLKPIKNDQSGEQRFVKSFIILNNPDALSTGDAVDTMLKGDPMPGDQKQIALFKDPQTGREITYELASRRFKEALTKSGYPELATGLHCIRKGGATAYCESAGEEVAGYMGLWSSDARLQYFHATSHRLERAGMAVAMENGSELAVRPGALGSYAAGRRN